VFPSDNIFPNSCVEENKMLKMLGVEYISYHTCSNDFILYINEYVNKEICPECGHDRYHKSKNKGKAHGPPHNILRHMPIITRIQSLCHCKQLSMLQGWHASYRTELGVMKIPPDSISMNHTEDTWPNKFKDEVRSLRLSTDMDGVHSYSLQNTNYLVWPMVVINNNIPPWLFMKNKHLMLGLIVSGRRKVKRMDVYLQPLIDEFKKLWEGIHVYVVSICIPIERSFTLYGTFLYTTHDYPRLGVFSRKHVHKFVYICNLIWHASFGATIFLTLTCYVYDKITGIVTKVYHGCKCCGPSIKIGGPTTYER
jgi:hypothetical protein